MSVKQLLEDLDIENIDDEVELDNNEDIVEDVISRLFVTDEEGNLVSAHIYANEILLTYELTEEELLNLLKESGEDLKFFTFTLDGVEELVIGNELCTIEDIKNRFLSSIEDGEDLEFDVVEIKDKNEQELPTEEQLKEGLYGDYIYYCISDGMNPRNSIIIPNSEGAREKAIKIAKESESKFKYVSMFKNGDEIVIWHANDWALPTGMKMENESIKEEIKEGPNDIFGYVNGGLKSFEPKAFVEKCKTRGSLHTNRMIKDTDDVKICHHIVCDVLGLNSENPKVWVDVVEETWTRHQGDADDARSYQGEVTQNRILMENCGKGEEGFVKAIEVLEKYKKDTLSKNESVKEILSDKEVNDNLEKEFRKNNIGYKFYEIYCEPNEEIKYDKDNFSLCIRVPITEPKPTEEEVEEFLGDEYLLVNDKRYHVVGVWGEVTITKNSRDEIEVDGWGEVFNPLDFGNIIDYKKPQSIQASLTK